MFCSSKCSDRAKYLRRLERFKEDTDYRERTRAVWRRKSWPQGSDVRERTCGSCGASYISDAARRYCGLECRQNARNARRRRAPKARVLRVAVGCLYDSKPRQTVLRAYPSGLKLVACPECRMFGHPTGESCEWRCVVCEKKFLLNPEEVAVACEALTRTTSPDPLPTARERGRHDISA